ncbi:cytochrome P450 [Hymenopellis radicata]|nr:cytochrome P450 [Hymenopellis radicata]
MIPLLLVVLAVVAFVGLKLLFRPKPFKHIPGPPAASWVMGNLSQLFTAKGLPFHQGLVDTYGGMVKVFGFFGDEQLYISDPIAVNAILGKEQDAFDETAVFLETNKVIFGPGLVATNGEQHKRQRKLVAPVFSVTQLKALMPVFYAVSERLVNAIDGPLSDDGSALDMSEWMSRVALEMIGQTVLGYSFDPLNTPHNNPYTLAIKELIPTLFSLSLVRQFAPFLSRMGPPAFRRWLVEHTPHHAVQKVKAMSDVMHDTACAILNEKRMGEKEGRDIISVLLRANEKAAASEKMSENELTGQMTVLIFGAQDTTSSALSRILFLISRDLDIQERVRDEIKSKAGPDGQLEYEDIIALPVLDAIIKETLRLYPPVPFVRRTAVKERVLTYSEGTENVTVPVGTTLFVGIAGFNRLESVWGADAKQWKPERWLSSTPTDERPGIYHGMLSFLGGNRSCIGYKFAQVEMKVLLSTLLLNFRFKPTADEIVWNLSQIISPSVVTEDGVERKGLPLLVERIL